MSDVNLYDFTKPISDLTDPNNIANNLYDPTVSDATAIDNGTTGALGDGSGDTPDPNSPGFSLSDFGSLLSAAGGAAAKGLSAADFIALQHRAQQLTNQGLSTDAALRTAMQELATKTHDQSMANLATSTDATIANAQGAATNSNSTTAAQLASAIARANAIKSGAIADTTAGYNDQIGQAGSQYNDAMRAAEALRSSEYDKVAPAFTKALTDSSSGPQYSAQGIGGLATQAADLSLRSKYDSVTSQAIADAMRTGSNAGPLITALMKQQGSDYTQAAIQAKLAGLDEASKLNTANTTNAGAEMGATTPLINSIANNLTNAQTAAAGNRAAMTNAAANNRQAGTTAANNDLSATTSAADSGAQNEYGQNNRLMNTLTTNALNNKTQMQGTISQNQFGNTAQGDLGTLGNDTTLISSENLADPKWAQMGSPTAAAVQTGTSGGSSGSGGGDVLNTIGKVAGIVGMFL